MAIVFWDFDGTLVYSGLLWSNSAFSALKETLINTDIQFNDIRKCMAKGFPWHTPDNDYSNLTGEKWWHFMVDKITNDFINLGVEQMLAITAAAKVPDIIKNTDNYIPYDDAVISLEKSLKAGNKNVMLSNNYPDLSDVVDDLGLLEYFDRIIISAQVGYDKPRKEIFDIAKSYYADDNYIMIGDSVTADIIGGNNAGMKTVLVHNGYYDKADFCCENLDEICFFV